MLFVLKYSKIKDLFTKNYIHENYYLVFSDFNLVTCSSSSAAGGWFWTELGPDFRLSSSLTLDR